MPRHDARGVANARGAVVRRLPDLIGIGVWQLGARIPLLPGEVLAGVATSKACGAWWSGRWESNPRLQLGKLG
ncbi:protein of unknown function [Paraburkholderia kururiensis]